MTIKKEVKIITICVLLIIVSFQVKSIMNDSMSYSNIEEEIQLSKEFLEEMNAMYKQNILDKEILENLKKDLVSLKKESQSLNSNISEKSKEEMRLLEQNSLLHNELSLIKEKKKVIPYIYYDSVLEDELINTIITHFEAIRTSNKDKFISTISSSDSEWLMRRLEYEPQYIKNIRYVLNSSNSERIFPNKDSFFIEVLTTSNLPYQGSYNIGVTKSEGGWIVHDYD